MRRENAIAEHFWRTTLQSTEEKLLNENKSEMSTGQLILSCPTCHSDCLGIRSEQDGAKIEILSCKAE